MKDLYLEKQKDINVSLFNNLNNFFKSSSSYQKPLKKIKFKKKIDGFFVFSLSRRNCMILITNPKGEVKYKFTSGLVEDLKNVRKFSNAILVCKRGALGCSVYEDEIPNHLDEGLTISGVRVEVLNVLGAGDAFMGSLIGALLKNYELEKGLNIGSAAAAIVVSRVGCAPAMPSLEEILEFMRANTINEGEK